MSQLTINNVRIAGMSACVPATVEDNLTLPIYKDQNDALKVIASTGIERHHKVEPGTTASDLTVKAVERVSPMCARRETILLPRRLAFFRTG